MRRSAVGVLAGVVFIGFFLFIAVDRVRAASPDPSPSFLVAVFPLEDLRPSGDTEGLGEALAAGITDGLNGAPGVRVVERQRLKALMDEIGLSMTGAVDERTALRVGKLLGANHLILGSFMKFRSQVRVNARVVRTETGEITGTAKVTGSFEKIFELEERLVSEILSAGLKRD
ncbi:MAG TPA: CsgG/HfaB family protein [Syntrophales bacterium]|nr:CsgG/HfaB family protein [Syntrophales bacterium]